MRQRADPWRPYYQQLTDVLLPNRADFTRQQNPGQSREVGIYDGTPRLALRDLASTLDGLIKPASSPWFQPTCEDEDRAKSDEAKLWFEAVRDRMWRSIYNKNARFIQRSGETDLMLACIGWGPLWIQENDTRNGLLFRTFPTNNVCFDENSMGQIDCFAAQEDMSARQAATFYMGLKKDVPVKITDAIKAGSNATVKTFTFIQITLPRDDYDAAEMKANKSMPYVSAVLDMTNESVVTEMGFYEFPVALPRWDTAPGEIYPRSPGMMALPDARTLQAMGKTLLIGGQRAVDPPVWVANDSVLSPLRTFPGGITILDTQSIEKGPPIGTLPVSENIPLGRDMQNDYRTKVEAAFFKNIFNLPMNAPNMTATEVLERKDEFIRTIGPVFGRLETDYIGHIVPRCFGIMERAGAFPPRPDVLAGANITFTYQSPIQQARRQVEIAGFGRAMEMLTPLLTLQPEILDNFDGDEIARDAPTWSGMSQRWLRTKDAVQQKREGQQAAQHGADAMAAMPALGKTVKDVAQAQQLQQQQPQQLPQPGLGVAA